MRRRSRRATVPIGTLSLVGYTNAGKSTLFNRLTQASVLTSSRMFATLDPTLRLLELPSRRRVLVSDTVGFIRNLPHTLIKAFRATLEEVREAEMIIRVSDCSVPGSAQQEEDVEKVLAELGALDKPCLHIQNKIDRLTPEERKTLRKNSGQMFISAKTGEGMEELLGAIDRHAAPGPCRESAAALYAARGKTTLLGVRAGAACSSATTPTGFIAVDAEVPQSLATSTAKASGGTGWSSSSINCDLLPPQFSLHVPPNLFITCQLHSLGTGSISPFRNL